MTEKYRIPELSKEAQFGVGLAEMSLRSQNIRSLVAAANLENVKIHDASKSPYTINPGPPADVPAQKFVSPLGTVVYSNIIFNAGRIFDDNLRLVDQWPDFRIDDCLIAISQSKKLIVTDIQGKDNQVVEYIGKSSYQINIVGRLNGTYGVHPKEETKTLEKIFGAGQPIAITNWWLQNLNVTDIVVTDYSFGQNEGNYSTQYFSMNAISDMPTEVRITQ